jgi:hypothetical protein
VQEVSLTDKDNGEVLVRNYQGQMEFRAPLSNAPGQRYTPQEGWKLMQERGYPPEQMGNVARLMNMAIPTAVPDPHRRPKHVEFIDTPEELAERVHQDVNDEAWLGRRLKGYTKGELRIGNGFWSIDGGRFEGDPTKELLEEKGVDRAHINKILTLHKQPRVSAVRIGDAYVLPYGYRHKEKYYDTPEDFGNQIPRQTFDTIKHYVTTREQAPIEDLTEKMAKQRQAENARALKHLGRKEAGSHYQTSEPTVLQSKMGKWRKLGIGEDGPSYVVQTDRRGMTIAEGAKPNQRFKKRTELKEYLNGVQTLTGGQKSDIIKMWDQRKKALRETRNHAGSLNWEDYGRQVLQHKKDLSQDPLTALSVEGNLNRRKFLYTSDAVRNKVGQEAGVFGWVKNHIPTLDGIERAVEKVERLSDLTERAGKAIGTGGTVIGKGISGVTKLVGVATGYWRSRGAAEALEIATVMNEIQRKIQMEEAGSVRAQVLHDQLMVEQNKLRLEAQRANASNYVEFERTMRDLAESERREKERANVTATEFNTNVTIAKQKEKERLEELRINASRTAAQNNQSSYDIALIPAFGDQRRDLQQKNLSASIVKSQADLDEARHRHALRNITADQEVQNATHAGRMGGYHRQREEIEQNYTTVQLWKDSKVLDYVNDVDRYTDMMEADLKMNRANISALEEGELINLRHEDLPNRTEFEKALRDLALLRQEVATQSEIKDRQSKLAHLDGYGHQLIRWYKAVVPNECRAGLTNFLSWGVKMSVREGVAYALEQAGQKDVAKEVRKEKVGSPFLTEEEQKWLEKKREKKKAKRRLEKKSLLSSG